MSARKRKRPHFRSEVELRYYERVPKHVLFAICADYAMRAVGETESIDEPGQILESIKETERILRDNRLFP